MRTKNRILCVFMCMLLVLFSSCGDSISTEESYGGELEVSDDNESLSSDEADGSRTEESFDSLEESLHESADSAESTADVFSAKLKYVALGDSIAYGYGLEQPEKNSYPGLLSEKLSLINGERDVEYINLAVSGMDTKTMLDMLSDAKEQLEDADLISLCIGANNLLQPFLKMITETMAQYGVVGENGTVAGVDLNRLNEMIASLGELLKSKELFFEFRQGIEQFEKDFDVILSTIKSYAPNATVAVMTVYSPFEGICISLPYLEQTVDLGVCSDEWVSKLNVFIKEIASKYNCIIVDTYDAFRNDGSLVNAAISIVPLRFSMDPHPTATGHELLAELHFKELKNSCK